jgi:hypothetical protein
MKKIGLFLLALTLFVGANAAQKEVNMDSLKEAIISNSKEIQEQKKDSAMYSKLSPNQILDLKKGELEVQKEQIQNAGRNQMPFNGFELFMICLLPFLFVATIIIVQVKQRKKNLNAVMICIQNLWRWVKRFLNISLTNLKRKIRLPI